MHTTHNRPEPTKKSRRPSFLTAIPVQTVTVTETERQVKVQTVTVTERQVKVYLLRAEIEHLKRLRLRIENLHLQRKLSAPVPVPVPAPVPASPPPPSQLLLRAVVVPKSATVASYTTLMSPLYTRTTTSYST